jgi:hypothetical protein
MTTRSQYRRYSQPEYRALAEVLSQFKNPSGIVYSTAKRARLWLWGGTDRDRKLVFEFLNKPLEEMPLLINHGTVTERVLALWRMKIGK